MREELTMRPDPTDTQLAAIIRHLVRKHLEVERGLRPPEHFHNLMTPHAYRRLRASNRAHFDRQGPVHPRDLGNVRLTRYPDGRIHSSVATREQDNRWGAVVMQLRLDPGRGLQITSLERLRRGTMRHRTRPEQEFGDLPDRIRRVDEERRLMQAALNAEQRRLRDRSPGTASEATSLVESYAHRINELDNEHATLIRRQRLSEGLSHHSPSTPHDHIIRMLGEPPDDAGARRLWQTAYGEIEHYRRDWDVATDTALGPCPEQGTPQRRHYDHVVSRLRAATTYLSTTSAPPAERHLDLSS